jgi:hypothetical protein
VNGVPVRPTPLDEIASVEVRELSVGWTVGGIVLTTVGVMALLFVASCADSEFYCE